MKCLLIAQLLLALVIVTTAQRCRNDAACNDNDQCTSDQCVFGRCIHIPTLNSCDDGNACTEMDRCVLGKCVGVPKMCDDWNICTEDKCSNGQCVHTNRDIGCEDGNLCTENDRCVNGQCKSGASKNCDDNNVCTEDSCKLGLCLHVPRDGTCDDGKACTASDHCALGLCISTDYACENRQCYWSRCAENGECQYEPQGTIMLCDDGDSSTIGDHCDGNGNCISGHRICLSVEQHCIIETSDSCNGEVIDVDSDADCHGRAEADTDTSLWTYFDGTCTLYVGACVCVPDVDVNVTGIWGTCSDDSTGRKMHAQAVSNSTTIDEVESQPPLEEVVAEMSRTLQLTTLASLACVFLVGAVLVFVVLLLRKHNQQHPITVCSHQLPNVNCYNNGWY